MKYFIKISQFLENSAILNQILSNYVRLGQTLFIFVKLGQIWCHILDIQNDGLKYRLNILKKWPDFLKNFNCWVFKVRESTSQH